MFRPLSIIHVCAEIKSVKHIQGAVARRAPTIQNIAKKYNVLCNQIEQMVKHGTAPLGAIVPEQIPPGGLWTLDVDDRIWQDIGLSEEPDSCPPLWLRDENVRDGIRNLLDHDRCLEEEARVLKERQSLQESARNQWAILSLALVSAAGESDCYFYAFGLTRCYIDDSDLVYSLSREAKELCRLCFLWRRDCRIIPCNLGESWGPSESEIMAAGTLEFNTRLDFDSGPQEDLSAEEEEPCDEELYEQLETMALREEYRGQATDGVEVLSSDSESGVPISPSKKRRRTGH